MKEGTAITKIVMFFLAACLAAYFGVHIWRGMTDNLVTAVAYRYTVNDSVEAEGLLVRQEQVLAGSNGIAEVKPGEGERVGAGQAIAVIYRDGQALEREERIQALTLEAELLQDAMRQITGSDVGAAELEDDVVRAVVALRFGVSADDFGRLEDQVLDLKRAVLRRDYTYGQSVDGSRLAQIDTELKSLRSQANRDTSQIFARQAGTYSAQVDGLEGTLDLERAKSLSRSELEELLGRKPQRDDQALGKLITSNRWGLAILLPQERAKQLSVGESVTVGFSGDFEKDVSMQVDSVGPEEQGECVVLLSTDRYLSSTTLLRRQSVEIIFDRDEGVRVPKESVHIVTKTATDEAGQPTQTSTTGVYVVVNNRAQFKPVEVLAQGGQFYVVRPVAEGKDALRAGDEVIVRGKDVQDGSVVSE